VVRVRAITRKDDGITAVGISPGPNEAINQHLFSLYI
jgi:hypothetical protein